MCGIGVIIDDSPKRVRGTLLTFLETQAHRGPDDAGEQVLTTMSGTTIGFAHRRLSIIDLSASGHQPMIDEQGNVIVYNGEIYNHREIADELRRKGEHFLSTSDTEVLLRAYSYYGTEELLNKLRGMFAFALWDAKKQKLLVARDPMGIKPLYYTGENGGYFACASEAKALVGAGLVDGTIDRRGLDSFLAYGSVTAPLTIWRGVSALMPGCYLWVGADGRAAVPRRYWSRAEVLHASTGQKAE